MAYVDFFFFNFELTTICKLCNLVLRMHMQYYAIHISRASDSVRLRVSESELTLYALTNIDITFSFCMSNGRPLDLSLTLLHIQDSYRISHVRCNDGESIGQDQ